MLLSHFDELLFTVAKDLPRGIKYWVIATEVMETAEAMGVPPEKVTWEVMLDRLRGDS